jgi:Zn-finger nucleic acid-binding protein
MDWCPADGSTLESVDVEFGSAAVCRECRGIWVPGNVARAISLSQKGWRCWVPFTEAREAGATCPAGHGPMSTFEIGGNERIDYCHGCGGIWLPGAVLQERHEDARRAAGNDDPFPNPPHGLVLGAAAVTVDIDPAVVHNLLMDSASVWDS